MTTVFFPRKQHEILHIYTPDGEVIEVSVREVQEEVAHIGVRAPEGYKVVRPEKERGIEKEAS